MCASVYRMTVEELKMRNGKFSLCTMCSACVRACGVCVDKNRIFLFGFHRRMILLFTYFFYETLPYSPRLIPTDSIDFVCVANLNISLFLLRGKRAQNKLAGAGKRIKRERYAAKFTQKSLWFPFIPSMNTSADESKILLLNFAEVLEENGEGLQGQQEMRDSVNMNHCVRFDFCYRMQIGYING